MSKSIETTWTDIAKSQFLGRKIIGVRYMTEAEMEDLGWHQRSIVLLLDDGNLLYPSSDDEGNNAGALFTNNTEQGTIPVLR